MESYYLSNYELSCLEIVQSLFVSEYGLRHLEQAKLDSERAWGHYTIALIQFVPVIGQIAMIIEWIAFKALGSHVRNSDAPIKEWLFKGTQEGCYGHVSQNKAASVFTRLFQNRERGVTFNPAKITDYLQGGACTAMGFGFADEVSRLKAQRCSKTQFLNGVRSLRQQFKNCSEEMRVRQAAFNTIEVQGNTSDMDIARNKVQSLANLHNYKIDHTSQEIRVGNGDCSAAVRDEMAQMPDGLYLLRSVKPANNEKLEECGHSWIYFKDQQEGIIYDSNYGAKYMNHVDHAQEISQNLNKYFEDFQTSRARFYRLGRVVN